MTGVPGKLRRPPLATAELEGRVGVPAGVPEIGKEGQSKSARTRRIQVQSFTSLTAAVARSRSSPSGCREARPGLAKDGVSVGVPCGAEAPCQMSF